MALNVAYKATYHFHNGFFYWRAGTVPTLIALIMQEIALTTDILIVFSLLGLAVVLFIFDLLRVDLVGLLMMVLLPLTGVVSGQEAIMGLSSNAVVSIIAVMIIGAGLNRTGVMNLLAQQIIKIAGKSETRIMVVISATVSIISSFMQNIGAAALFLPATSRISQQLQVPVSRILMPMGFCAIIGGCLTLVGSSPLIMLNDLMRSWWENNADSLAGQPFEPLSLFSVTPIGLALLVGGLVYFMTIGRLLLPKGGGDVQERLGSPHLREIYKNKVDSGFELTVPAGFKAQTLEELEIRPKYHTTVVGIAKDGGMIKNLAPTKESLVEPGDRLAIASTHDFAHQIASDFNWQIKDKVDTFSDEFSPSNYGLMEALVPPGSSLAGHSMEEYHFRRLYQINPLAIFRSGQVMLDRINIRKLKPGDALLLLGPWEQFHILQQKRNLVFTEELRGELSSPEKAKTALFFLGLSLFLALGLGVQLSIALLTGALGMILTNVIQIDDAYKAVDWMTIFLLSGLIPLGTAFEKTGAADYIAGLLLSNMGELTPLLLTLIVALLTSFFALVASNVGATVVMVPLAMNMALKVGVDPILMGLTVALAASNTFILPTHQVNALIMRPGGYKTMDYMKAGLGMSLLYLLIQLAMLSFY